MIILIIIIKIIIVIIITIMQLTFISQALKCYIDGT